MSILDNKLYLGGIVLIVFGVVVFILNYQIKATVKSELDKIRKKEAKKIKDVQKAYAKRQMQEQRTMVDREINDMDSYIDPSGRREPDRDRDERERYDEEDYRLRPQGTSRLSKDDIGQRDLMGV